MDSAPRRFFNALKLRQAKEEAAEDQACDNDVPRAKEVFFELGLVLAIPLALALVVGLILQVTSISSP